MLATIFQKIYQQTVLLVVVAVVLLAAYVSAGRQFMPVVSRYAEFLENQILESTGIPVSVDAITGAFSGFNPVINIDGLQLAVADDLHPDEAASSAFFFDRAMIEVDMLSSIWQRRWVMKEFVIESLELVVEQNAEGGWQLSGVDVAGDEPVDINALYQTFLSLSSLDLNNVAVTVRTLSGESLAFTDGLATIQNQGDEHYLHVNANLEGNPQPLTLSMEVQGNELSQLAGRLHVNIPHADYSPLLMDQNFGALDIQQINGGGEFWIDLANGSVVSASTELEIDDIVLAVNESNALDLSEITGRVTVARGLAIGHWEVAMSNMAVNYGDEFWRDFSGYLYLVPDQIFSVRADQIDIGLLGDIVLDSDLLDESAQHALASYSPDGMLQNFNLMLPLGEGNVESMRVQTNLVDMELGSLRGSPNMWGITGFLELAFDPQAQRVTGVAEVESDDFSINIPNTFTRVWDFDHVNGRLHIDVDISNGVSTKLVSSAVIAESEALDGRVRFHSVVHRYPDESREANLELFVGVSRLDAEYKSLFLPDGPQVQANLRNSMGFLERAIRDGDIHDSGVIFRGNTIQGSAPVSKTFQSFFQLENGEINYSDEWPDLDNVSARVITDDSSIDIAVSEASSLGVGLRSATGSIRRDAEDKTWLNVTGDASASTAQGLAFLQQTPVDENLRATFSNWTVAGDFSADVDVIIPLNQDDSDSDVRLDIALADNELSIPDFDLAVSNLSGPVIFDTRTGLEDSSLTARLFGGAVDIRLSSEFGNGSLNTIMIEGSGITTPSELIAWPQQSGLVRDLLAHMEGEFSYNALMEIDQTGMESINNKLLITSDLFGAGLQLPYPLEKSPESTLPLALQLEFDEENLGVAGTLGPDLTVEMQITDGLVDSGFLALGRNSQEFTAAAVEAPSGLVIVADVDYFDLQPWTDFVRSLGTAGETTSDFGNTIASIDINTEVLSIYDQELPRVSLQIEPDRQRQGWFATVSSDSVLGSVVIPYDNENYFEVDLDFLRLPATEEIDEQLVAEETGAGEIVAGETVADETETERIDPLLDLDPRELPLMRFSTEEFAIGERQYGSWEFTLIPTEEGAEFDDINFDFRGLRLGRDELDDRVEALDPHFRWVFDGTTHRSELTGVLVADDIGSVLEANGYAPSLESERATFVTEVDWPGSPAFFSGDDLSGRIDLLVEDGRFNRNSGGQGALRLVSFINLTAIFQRLRFSDDLLRRGLAYDEITGHFTLQEGRMHIEEQLVITGPSSLYQITGDVDLGNEFIEGEMFVTLPVSNNLPWIGLLTANLPLAVGAYLFDQIFGDQVDSLSSAVYTLNGPFEGLEPQFKQAFGTPPDASPAEVDESPAQARTTIQ